MEMFGMKRFVKVLFCFSLLLSVVMVAADFCYSLVIRNANEGNMEIWKEVFDGEASADILLSGDSRVNTDCYPPVIDSLTGLECYAAGVIGHHFTVQRLRYDMYSEFNRKPSLLIQFVDNRLFHPLVTYDSKQFLPWMWKPKFLSSFPWDFSFSSFMMFVPWLRYHGCRLSEMSWRGKATLRGFFTYDLNHDFSRLPEEKLSFYKNKKNEDMFHSFLSEVKSEGIKIVLVLAPMYEGSSFDQELLDKIRMPFISISEEFGVPLLDYLDWPLCGDKSLFLDSVHLNLKGARIFSSQLARDLVEMEIIPVENK